MGPRMGMGFAPVVLQDLFRLLVRQAYSRLQGGILRCLWQVVRRQLPAGYTFAPSSHPQGFFLRFDFCKLVQALVQC